MLNRIRKNDTVFVTSGRDKGKTGKVLEVNTKKKHLLIKDISVVTKHQKAKKQGETGGIIKKEVPVPFCKVMPVCTSCKKACRIKVKAAENGGKKLRACHRCNSEF